MPFDLRSRYSFDPSEGQIPEGESSPWGPQNSHANCVPASFTAALGLLGYPDVDPEQIIVDEYGLSWRGGTDFAKSIDWIQRNVANPPAMTHGAFDFDQAEAAGQAGQIPIIAGWIDAPSVTFNAIGEKTGWSHASILAAHLDDDSFVIFNIWRGTFQTYSRNVMAASLYEMAVMTSSAGSPQEVDDMNPNQDAALMALHDFVLGNPPDGSANLITKLNGTYARIGPYPLPPAPPSLANVSEADQAQLVATMSWDAIEAKYPGARAYLQAKVHPPTLSEMVAALSVGNNAAVIAELKNIEVAIADLKAHPASSDPRLLASITNIEKAAAAAGTALAQA